MDAFNQIQAASQMIPASTEYNNGAVSLDRDLYVHISEPKRFKEGLGQKRVGFQKTVFEKQYFVTATLYDHSQGHGQVKSVIIRNPAPEYLVKLRNPALWNIQKITVTLVVETGDEVERTFRVVTLRTSSGDQVMSNTLEQQLANLAEGSKRRDFKVNGEPVLILGYVNAKGELVKLMEDEVQEEDPKSAGEPKTGG